MWYLGPKKGSVSPLCVVLIAEHLNKQTKTPGIYMYLDCSIDRIQFCVLQLSLLFGNWDGEGQKVVKFLSCIQNCEEKNSSQVAINLHLATPGACQKITFSALGRNVICELCADKSPEQADVSVLDDRWFGLKLKFYQEIHRARVYSQSHCHSDSQRRSPSPPRALTKSCCAASKPVSRALNTPVPPPPPACYKILRIPITMRV